MKRLIFRKNSHASLLFILVIPAFLSGCGLIGHWPDEGKGGFGEYEPVTDPRLIEQMARLEDLRLRGAARFAAGNLAELDLLIIRTRRELVAGLPDDAAHDMERIEDVLRVAEQRMQKVTKQ